MRNDEAGMRSQRSLLTARQEQVAERIYEDEGLTGELSDAPARALIDWAVAQVVAAAERRDLDDARLSAYSKAVRAAARSAARSGQNDQQALVAHATAELSSSASALRVPVVTPTNAAPVEADHAPVAGTDPLPAAPRLLPTAPAPAQPLLSWEERWRRWLRKDR